MILTYYGSGCFATKCKDSTFSMSKPAKRERWKIDPEAPNYEVSTHGRFRNAKTGRLLTGRNQNGWIKAHLQVNGKRKHPGVHRMVLRTFRGPCPPGMEGCHKDSVRDNNFLDNLIWGTKADQYKHRVLTGNMRYDRLADVEVLEMRRRYKAGETAAELSEVYGITHQRACDAIKGRTYGYLKGAVKENLYHRLLAKRK